MEGPPGFERLREKYGELFDPGVSAAGCWIEVDPAKPPTIPILVAQVVSKLEESRAASIEVRVAGTALGVVTRASLEDLEGTAAGEAVPVSSGDRATLAGESSQFRALRYACPESGCGKEKFRSFHDARFLPSCGTDGHRLMELCE
ncbi:hypothetical protein [Actinoplanes sp. NPDC049802]|uniref:hypothetical protein n=1 Tax=Actinoplanes sp. NPDC049802 TaxID=3154742 RepID=UPI003401017A